jgi:hypothetical protein
MGPGQRPEARARRGLNARVDPALTADPPSLAGMSRR